ncbi:bifunctional adenosylcobinamide kinase/adenosylcobinamide-phosphate guanylyltransferase [Shewanella aestuarii]|uniref:Bifunctional adenosylcobalamin biosynthesis protein n=1 Tax=Shewanella aestuarii TaxID=1028752 RepID=A0A6G9QMY5_9GAMM|nr:bifunctional adenosylcobinamide kinase/adenosylcobinamide-phosphate guanylyltransferase [Shewanella aestuarii]QIR15417.1 bifunctional adenosylcobinamide kinase/adenosylcobinamide-phosphate guanylyltransferase [Shewanella aestuarii]
MLHLVLGGARSGKSRYAEQRVAERLVDEDLSAIYIATATAGDDEMQRRIQRHQQDRITSNVKWHTIEAPLALAATLKQIDKPNQIILVDCLTLYITNHLFACEQGDSNQCAALNRSWLAEKQQLLSLLPKLQADIILVSNEVGSGIVPLGELSREFVDEAGWLNQAIATIADDVSLVVAGLPLSLKSSKPS